MYVVETVEEVSHQVGALPKNGIDAFAALVDLLKLHPWSGDAYIRQRPEGNMRTHPFGDHSEGLAIYVILEEERRVVIVRVLWLG